MNYQDAYIGAQVLVSSSHGNWLGEIVRKVANSYTRVIVRDIDRGEGWNELLQDYTGVKVSNSTWYRGQNYGYGEEHKCHIKNLELLPPPEPTTSNNT